MGTHPSGPSVVAATGQTLKDWVQAHPDALGKAVLKRFGTDLPFLFKVGTHGSALTHMTRSPCRSAAPGVPSRQRPRPCLRAVLVFLRYVIGASPADAQGGGAVVGTKSWPGRHRSWMRAGVIRPDGAVHPVAPRQGARGAAAQGATQRAPSHLSNVTVQMLLPALLLKVCGCQARCSPDGGVPDACHQLRTCSAFCKMGRRLMLAAAQ